MATEAVILQGQRKESQRCVLTRVTIEPRGLPLPVAAQSHIAVTRQGFPAALYVRPWRGPTAMLVNLSSNRQWQALSARAQRCRLTRDRWFCSWHRPAFSWKDLLAFWS